MRGRRLGEILVAHGRITAARLEAVVAQQQRIDGRLGELLVAQGLVAEADVVRALSEQSGIPYISEEKIASMAVPTEAVRLLPADRAERLCALPIMLRGKELFCALLEPRDLAALDEIQFLTGVAAVRGVFATRQAIRRGLRRFYHGESGEADWERLVPVDEPLFASFSDPGEGTGSWEIPGAPPQPQPSAIERLRERLVAALVERRGPMARLPELTRRLAIRLGAPAAEVERAAAAAEILCLLGDRSEWEILGEAAAPFRDLLEAAAGAPADSRAARAIAGAAAFARATGTTATEPASARALLSLRRDPRIGPDNLLALGAELSDAWPPEAPRVLVAVADAALAAALVAELLAAGLPVQEVQDQDELRRALRARLRGAILGDLPRAEAAALFRVVREQPGCREMPLVIVGRGGPAPSEAVATLVHELRLAG